jgi:membrane protease YdiL (CAAX protease family)
MALTGLLGFYLGAVTIWTEDLLLAMVAHASYDAIQLIQVQKRKTK